MDSGRDDDTSSIATTTLRGAAGFDDYSNYSGEDSDDSDDSATESIATSRLMRAADFDTMSEYQEPGRDESDRELNPAAKPFVPTKIQLMGRVTRCFNQYSIRSKWCAWSAFIDENPYLFYSWTKHIHPWFVMGTGNKIVTSHAKGYLYLRGRPVTPKAVRRFFKKLFPEMEMLRKHRSPSVMRFVILRAYPVGSTPPIDFDAFDMFYSLPSSCQNHIRTELIMMGINWFEAHVV